MSSENVPDTASSDNTDKTQSSIEALEAHAKPGSPVIEDRLSVVRGRVQQYDLANNEAEQHAILDRIESELEEIRATIEHDLEEGAEEAHELLDDLEERVANLR